MARFTVTTVMTVFIWLTVSGAEPARAQMPLEGTKTAPLSLSTPVRILDIFGTIQKVEDLPDLRSLEWAKDQYMDLGYRHKDWGGGEWVGYIGTTSAYIPLQPALLQHMLKLAGLRRPPPPPPAPLGDLYFIATLLMSELVFFAIKRAFITKDTTATRYKSSGVQANQRLRAVTEPNQKKSRSYAEPTSLTVREAYANPGATTKVRKQGFGRR
ncbi:MAG: hypothetical protein AAGG72_01145 [Pseudomonadota bacterium]